MPTPPVAVDEVGPARKAIASEWAKYDALPVRSKEILFATLESALRLVNAAPPSVAPVLDAEVRASSRERMAKLIRPEASATGPAHSILVPSLDQTQCLVWGSMWTNKSDTVESLILLGFTEVLCGERRWKIDAATVKSGGVATNGGVMLFDSPAQYDEAIKCVQTYQPGNPEAAAEARQFENPTQALDQLRAMCLMGAADSAKFLQIGNRVRILKRNGKTAKVKVLTGTETGSFGYAASDTLAE